jgi:hypothetical protein
VSDTRRIEVFNGNGWDAVSGLEAVSAGRIFRMFEPNGTPVRFPKGSYRAIATKDGATSDNGPAYFEDSEVSGLQQMINAYTGDPPSGFLNNEHPIRISRGIQTRWKWLMIRSKR